MVPSNRNKFLIFLCDRVNVGEDIIEVDGISSKKVEPFQLRKLWVASSTVEQICLDLFKVLGEILKKSLGFL